MEEFMLTDDVFEQIKDFVYNSLTEEQSLLIDKLILNEELKLRYKGNGLCKDCKQPRASYYWCQCKFQQNFKNWTSGNYKVDKFIQKTQLKAKDYNCVLEWIEYDRFENVEYLAKGGFGTIYKAIWKDGWIYSWDFENNKWRRSKNYCRDYENFPVVLKCLHNSQDITSDFLGEIEAHIMFFSKSVFNITPCYGITKDPESKNFMLVMGYVINGSLRQHLNNSFNSTKWVEKLETLQDIAQGLVYIHENGSIHRDFHCGNILKDSRYTFITDFGLCRPVNVKPSQNECKELYGVLPYVAPEVLRGNEYTQERLRPKSNYKIPQLILNIIKQCWDADPLKRPKAKEIKDLLYELHFSSKFRSDREINKQIEDADKINEKLTSSSSLYTGPTLSYTTNPQAVYTSRLLDFKNLPKPKNSIDNKDDDDSFGEYSGN
ncbi:kinase-like domain-containing protein [Rhizophagus irregularis DAOM 181602=DAOM 197198]|uniref:Kinase-like domain-containing protein n=1 Tax=Rhizophagus irregularis (strain DAOM 181602 / DAOM 197198 / MUCL 43194) TaxID=747089 RepID=A0A2P4QZ80_RHIID|nr:kinase-like domain-containing protein [Rhizophagus irregularis DAOM 181602=DAOM 197198]POG82960.1 kinase-like domain-containing protein [Rhizophagus irregularis DAOM 181602=DAOM 197198]|eukprot:XP_025189826.1 kinase-like domain-containing protein [Rhizophagus irregularis DAOM 181602=DAOM 197198]